jgi:predicted ester cyclase
MAAPLTASGRQRRNSMSAQRNVATLSRIPNELYNEGSLAVLDEVFAPGYIEHFPLPPGFPAGAEAVRLYVTLVRTAFPDFRYTVEDVVAEGDTVVFRLTASGTQRGEFMGLPATGRAATWQEIHVGRCEGGKLVEHWAVIDQLGLLQQLGAIPAPAESAA